MLEFIWLYFLGLVFIIKYVFEKNKFNMLSFVNGKNCKNGKLLRFEYRWYIRKIWVRK